MRHCRRAPACLAGFQRRRNRTKVSRRASARAFQHLQIPNSPPAMNLIFWGKNRALASRRSAPVASHYDKERWRSRQSAASPRLISKRFDFATGLTSRAGILLPVLKICTVLQLDRQTARIATSLDVAQQGNHRGSSRRGDPAVQQAFFAETVNALSC